MDYEILINEVFFMDEAFEGIKGVFDKLTEFLNIFDLSFFISGFTCFGALLFWFVYVEGRDLPDIQGASRIIAVVLTCYVLGLICFALGRQFQKRYSSMRQYRNFDDIFIKAIEAHGLRQIEPYKAYLDRHRANNRTTWKLYGKLWAGLRNEEGRKACYALLSRYWMMAATFDGLAVAAFIWAIVLNRYIYVTIGMKAKCIIYFMLLVITAYIVIKGCFREADRYQEYQMEEIISVYADKEYSK